MKLIDELKIESDIKFNNSDLKKRLQYKHVLVFSASAGGRKVVKFLEYNNIRVEYILDNNKQFAKEKYNNIPIVLPEEINKYVDVEKSIVLSGSITYMGEIRQQLMKIGFKRENLISPLYISDRFTYYLADGIDDRRIIEENIDMIEQVMPILDDEESRFVYRTIIQSRYDNYLNCEKEYADIVVPNQYFDRSIVSLGSNEIFMDIGAFDGDSISDFVKAVNGKYREIYAFEPCQESYEKLKNNTNKFKNIHIFKCGLSNKSALLSFEGNDSGAHVTYENNSEQKIRVEIGDSFNIPATFIKMDIEGEEKNALIGLKETIIKYKPKLAICIYHRNEFKQLWEVPLYIKEICKDYKIKIVHHGYDTVCYATIE